MKRMVIALMLLGFIICTAFTTSYLAVTAIDETCEALKACMFESKNEKPDFLKTDKAVSEWNRNKVILYATMFHEDFFKIEENMIKLKILSEQQKFQQSSQLCVETELLLRNKKEEIKVSFENVF